MKTEKELNQDIIDLTLKITLDFPELSKYLSEIPVNNAAKSEPGARVKILEEYYHSLVNIVSEYSETHKVAQATINNKKEQFPDYPNYPSSEDIYSQEKEEKDLNPEDIAKRKSSNEKKKAPNEKSFKEDLSGDDLDVPGSELDDEQESIGSEDEENNYYSLGGDGHNDLDEEKE